MSILIAFLSKKYVALCTDCQHTNIETGLPGELPFQKIERFSDVLYIAHGGSAYIPLKCMQILQILYKDHDITDDSIANVTDALVKAYEKMIEIEPDIERKAPSKFIIAGKQNDGNLGLGIVESSPNGVVSRFVSSSDVAQVVIFEPKDVTYSECFDIVKKAYDQKFKSNSPQSIEVVLRESVEVVSEKSSYVSKESLFCAISLDETVN